MNITVETLCNIMTNPTEGTSLERLKIVNDLSLLMAEEKCLDHTYKTQVKTNKMIRSPLFKIFKKISSNQKMLKRYNLQPLDQYMFS